MQYDENGYPVKGRRETSAHEMRPIGGNNSSAAVSVPQPPAPSSYHPQQSGIQYDERGYPMKPSPQQAPTNHSPQQPQGPLYDENGHPIKSHRNDRNVALPAQYPHQYEYQNQSPPQPHPGMNNYPGYQGPHSQPIAGTQTSAGPVLQPYASQRAVINYWSTGLCDCADDFDVCIEGWLCLCCEEGRIYDALENNRQDSMNPFACCASCLCCLFFGLPVVNLRNRWSLIDKYNIQDENCCVSICFSCCCPCCSSCQVHRELQLRGVYPGGACCALSSSPKGPTIL